MGGKHFLHKETEAKKTKELPCLSQMLSGQSVKTRGLGSAWTWAAHEPP